MHTVCHRYTVYLIVSETLQKRNTLQLLCGRMRKMQNIVKSRTKPNCVLSKRKRCLPSRSTVVVFVRSPVHPSVDLFVGLLQQNMAPNRTTAVLRRRKSNGTCALAISVQHPWIGSRTVAAVLEWSYRKTDAGCRRIMFFSIHTAAAACCMHSSGGLRHCWCWIIILCSARIATVEWLKLHLTDNCN